MDRDGGSRENRVTRTLSRRRLVTAGAGLIGSLAGCNESNAPTETSTDRTATGTGTATTETGTETGTESATRTTGTTEAAGGFDASVLDASSGSAAAPTDGFAAADWLDGSDPSIVKVTSLDGWGAGTLRAALEGFGPRIVVFEVGGVVDLDGQHLQVQGGNCWIAGQTAPSPGITLVRGGLYVEADDCVVQHVRVRPGDAGRDGGWEPDAIHTGDATRNNVVDHCTATWGIDENLSVGYRSRGTTVTNCLIAEPLNDATHSKGPHGYGSLIGDNAEDVALVGNVWAHNVERNPRLKRGTRSVVVNNLVHHYHDGIWMDPDTRASIEGNVFEWPTSEQPNVFGDGAAHVADNALEWDADRPMVGDGITRLDERPLWPDGLEPLASGEVRSHALANAGARPADRTPHDERIIKNVRNGSGELIDSQTDVGGYPDPSPTTRPLDVPEPGDGLADWLRAHTRAVERPDARPP